MKRAFVLQFVLVGMIMLYGCATNPQEGPIVKNDAATIRMGFNSVVISNPPEGLRQAITKADKTTFVLEIIDAPAQGSSVRAEKRQIVVTSAGVAILRVETLSEKIEYYAEKIEISNDKLLLSGNVEIKKIKN